MGVNYDGESKYTYFDLKGKGEKIGIYQYVKGGESIKATSISGILVDIKLRKSKPPNHPAKFEWLFVLEDNEEKDNYLILVVAEASRIGQRVGNLLMGVTHSIADGYNGDMTLTFYAYKSEDIKSSVGVAMRIGDHKIRYYYDVWNPNKKNYHRKGDPNSETPVGYASDSNAVKFWRNIIFKHVYSCFLGKKWDGVIDDRTQSVQTAFIKNEEKQPTLLSPASKLVEKGIYNKKTVSDILVSWKKACEFINSHIQDEVEKGILLDIAKSHLLNLQEKESSGDLIDLQSDGTYRELPF